MATPEVGIEEASQQKFAIAISAKSVIAAISCESPGRRGKPARKGLHLGEQESPAQQMLIGPHRRFRLVSSGSIRSIRRHRFSLRQYRRQPLAKVSCSENVTDTNVASPGTQHCRPTRTSSAEIWPPPVEA